MEHEETQKNTRSSWSPLRPFQMISISLLSLLVPLSFLFLSRLSVSSSSAPVTVSGLLFSLLHQADVGVLYTILSLIIVSTLIHNLSGKPECSVLHSHLYICWIVLFIVQACVAFGIEGTMSTTMSITTDKSFSLAAQERVVVKPVVDDTVFGVYMEEERWSERAVVAVTFGLMWWWRLRDEVESLVVVAEVKRSLLIHLEGLDFVNWWMYYICVGIGLADVGVLYTILFLIIVFTLIHSLLGKPECSVLHSHLYICWIVLFIAQACAFGIKRTMSTTMSINPDKNLFIATHERCVLVRVLFFLGLHGVMLMWFRVVVKPVVDNTIYGVYVEERWSERAVVALTFGLMWWWRLRDEVESLVVVVTEDKRNLPIRLEGLNFVNWCMYYICVGIGLVKIFKGFCTL
ncbi:unnamed protein product [Arabidopsis halleri]